MQQIFCCLSTHIVAVLFLLLSHTLPASADELTLGVFPYLTPRHMVDQFTPLKDHLARELGRPVTLSSATDYRNFMERTAAGEFDIIFDAPHLARLAQKRNGYLPLAQTGYKILILVLARKDSPVQSLADLRGQSISIGARLSMTHQIIREELLKDGLVLERDVNFLDTAYFTNVLQSVIRGDAAAGATGTLLWDSAPEEERSQLREIFRMKNPVPGFILLAHPRLSYTTLRKLQQALLKFKDTPEGAAYFQKTRQVDFRTVDETTMHSIEPYTKMLMPQ